MAFDIIPFPDLKFNDPLMVAMETVASNLPAAVVKATPIAINFFNSILNSDKKTFKAYSAIASVGILVCSKDDRIRFPAAFFLGWTYYIRQKGGN